MLAPSHLVTAIVLTWITHQLITAIAAAWAIFTGDFEEEE